MTGREKCAGSHILVRESREERSERYRSLSKGKDASKSTKISRGSETWEERAGLAVTFKGRSPINPENSFSGSRKIPGIPSSSS